MQYSVSLCKYKKLNGLLTSTGSISAGLRVEIPGMYDVSYLAEDAAKQRQMRQLPGVGIPYVAPSQVTL